MAVKKKTTKSKKKLDVKVKMIGELIDATGSSKDSWNPAEISDDMKAISYIRKLADTWNPAQLNEALKYLDFKTVDTWNPAEIEETKNKLVKYFLPTNASGNPIELDLKGALPYEVTYLTIDLLPIQDLSHGEPSPTNICPICGRTEVNLAVTGINQWDEEWENGSINDNTGENVTGTNIRSKNYISVVPNTSYYFHVGSGSAIRVFFYGIDKTYLSRIDTGSTTFTVPTNAYYMRFRTFNAYGTTYNHDISINYPSTDRAYEPYQGSTVTVQFGQTVYGGTVNVLEGGTSSTYGYIASYNGEELPGAWISDRDVYAAGTTPTTGAEVVYVLATPTELTTSAEEVTLINGENNLSTDGDTINITYKAILNS